MDTLDGTWRFVRATARDDAGDPRPLPYDGQGMGRIVIGGGRMAVMMIDWRQDVPGGQKREYSGYTGTCTYDGKQLVTTVDAAPDPSRIGTKQPRGVRFEDTPDASDCLAAGRPAGHEPVRSPLAATQVCPMRIIAGLE